MQRLLDGYLRFRRDVFPKWKDRFRLLADRQAPEVLFITCADSRVVPDLILQTEPGDMFLCRTAGNIVPPHGQMAGGVSATIEYAVEVLEVAHIIVCGHSDCGAIKAMFDRRDLSRLPITAKWLGFIEPAWKYLEAGIPDDPRELHRALIRANVIAQFENLKTHPAVACALAHQRLAVHGWYYDILTGAIDAYDQRERKFAPLEQLAQPTSRPQI
ncbi:MAG TPA: carbonic anhydrase [Acidobacteriaceae bacterium]|nr:carbonic anhydrase [Acidobacteriaceae bacterium]